MGQIVKIDTKWLGDMVFESDVDGHKILLDTSIENGGKNSGPKPKPLMLVALAGCSGMDVVSLLKKMRVEYESLTISVEGEMADEHPKYFTKMKVIFKIKGENIPLEKVEQAVKMSKDKYCGVNALYSKAIPVEFLINLES